MLPRLESDEVRALSGLLGARWRAVLPGADSSVDLAALDEALRASRAACSLVEAAAAAHGSPLVDRRAVSHARRTEREDRWRSLHEHPAPSIHPACATGSSASDRPAPRFAPAAAIRSSCSATRSRCWQCFPPSRRRHSRGSLRHTARRSTCTRSGPPARRGAASRSRGPRRGARRRRRRRRGAPRALRPLGARLRRAVEHRAVRGSTAPRGGQPAGRRVCASAAGGEPRVVTLRELRGVELLDCGPVVWTCENPDVVAAAVDALGSAARR